jgi:hypothetical protein
VSKQKHLAFSKDHDYLAYQLITEVTVHAITTNAVPQKSLVVNAIWDTGASFSVITGRVATALESAPIGKAVLKGVNSEKETFTTLVAVDLPSGDRIDNLEVTVGELNSDKVDMLIGMDIILLGDFAVSNGGGATLFSFAMPPFMSKIDLVEKADATNSGNKT